MVTEFTKQELEQCVETFNQIYAPHNSDPPRAVDVFLRATKKNLEKFAHARYLVKHDILAYCIEKTAASGSESVIDANTAIALSTILLLMACLMKDWYTKVRWWHRF